MATLGVTDAQLGNLRAIRDECKRRGLPIRALIIAYMTAIQESGVRNLANGNNPESLQLPHDGVGWDHGSVGVFQQQVGGAVNSTANWGTTAELMNVTTSAGKFFTALSRVDYNNMSTGAAAQAVQGSAFPYAYQAHEQQATQFANALWNETGAATLASGGGGSDPKPAGAPYAISELHIPLTQMQRDGMVRWMLLMSINGLPGGGTLSIDLHGIQNASDDVLLAKYKEVIALAQVGQGLPGPTGPPGLSSALDFLKKAVKWLTDVNNWKRIGLFALGAAILFFAALKLVSDNTDWGAVSNNTAHVPGTA